MRLIDIDAYVMAGNFSIMFCLSLFPPESLPTGPYITILLCTIAFYAMFWITIKREIRARDSDPWYQDQL